MKPSFIATLTAKQLVDLYNGAASRRVKKFETRAIAEKRVAKVTAGWDEKQIAYNLKAIGVTYVPEPKITEKPAAAVITDALDKKVLAAINGGKKKSTVDGGPKKQKLLPHLNLRCSECGYYAKSTPAMLKIARLVCPVDKKHGALLTAEERGETRGPNRGGR